MHWMHCIGSGWLLALEAIYINAAMCILTRYFFVCPSGVNVRDLLPCTNNHPTYIDVSGRETLAFVFHSVIDHGPENGMCVPKEE